jgi:hypothetical protein
MATIDTSSTDASTKITAIVAGLDDGRGATLARVRELIHEADPDVVEEIKWVKPSNPSGVSTWTHDGIVCTGEIYKANVKLTFFRGAALDDPSGLFTSGLGGGTRRAIDLGEDADLDADAFRALVRAAVARNTDPTPAPTSQERGAGTHLAR